MIAEKFLVGQVKLYNYFKINRIDILIYIDIFFSNLNLNYFLPIRVGDTFLFILKTTETYGV